MSKTQSTDIVQDERLLSALIVSGRVNERCGMS